MPVEGSVDPGFEPVAEAFAGVVAGQAGPGASLAVWHAGSWVVDLWGGSADAGGSRPWRSDTIAMVYSVTKPFAAVCALLLADHGQLDLDAPLTSVLAGDGRPDDDAPGARPSIRPCRAGRAGPRGGLVRLGLDLPPARRAGSGLGARHGAGRGGAVLRAPRGRGRPACRRPDAGPVPARRGLRPGWPRLPRRAHGRRAAEGRGPRRLRRRVPPRQRGRDGPLPARARQPARSPRPGRGQRRALAPGGDPGDQRPRDGTRRGGAVRRAQGRRDPVTRDARARRRRSRARAWTW